LLGLPPLEVAGWGGIYSHQPNCSRWRRLLAMGAPDYLGYLNKSINLYK
jgi:hypothetical protein